MNNIYYLKNKNNYIISKIEINLDENTNPFKTFIGKAYECTAWTVNNEPIDWKFHSDFIIKSDACSHWYFYGEDYENDNESDSYYHLCTNPETFMIIMAFVWKCAKEYYLEQLYNQKKSKYYIESLEDNFNPSLLVFENLLNNYKII